MVCCCSLAGTAACRYCSNNPYSEPSPYRTIITHDYIIPYKEDDEELAVNIPPKTLTPSDLAELEHRFGKEVRFVIEDMLSGEGKRWEDKSTVKEN